MKEVCDVTEIRLVDTTLRDGQQSLWACRMRTEAMLPALADLDDAGFEALEFAVPTAQFPRAVRDLKENPWDWLKLGASRAQRTPLRLHGAAKSQLTHVPRSVQKRFLEMLAELGITTARTSNSWNNYDALERHVTTLASCGIKTVVNLIYSVSPLHTVEYYARKTREAAALDPYRICVKDVGGLLTPESARELFPVVAQNANGVPLEFHAHCSNGLAPYIALIAAEHGIGVIHTAIPPLADGSSQPSVFTMVSNLRARGFTVNIDMEPLERVSEHFFRVAEAENLAVGEPLVYDELLYRHQVPGGMISNMRYQLGQLGLEHRLDEALEEVPRIREELGFPIMVTPLSQFVGSQAALNVVTGQRYATVTDEIIEYAHGHWGQEAVEQMDPEIREKILARPRAQELRVKEVDEPSLDEVRARFGGNVSDEEIVTRIFAGVGTGKLDFRSVNPNASYDDVRTARRSFVDLVHEASADTNIRRFEYARGNARVVIRK
jgi:oxaloacetate decarboxylase alpha subunit